MHVSQFFIYETYLDLYGHVNNAKYMELYEQARWDWLNQSSLGADFIKSTNVGPVILKVEIEFIKEIKSRQTINIYTWVARHEKKIFYIEQEMRFPNGDLASRATFTGGLIDLNIRRLVEPNDVWIMAFKSKSPDQE
ncbi:acyl-CoA thioesterase [Myxococcota bacterium]|nr:acyl-CoA thioesterase [Myxococcota bacterium]MBU1897199.1 acyl-CoA thioesterase [Myxococcota bacterium]